MNWVSIRTKYIGGALACYGKTGWASRPAHATADTWNFCADDGATIVCPRRDMECWPPCVFRGEPAN